MVLRINQLCIKLDFFQKKKKGGQSVICMDSSPEIMFYAFDIFLLIFEDWRGKCRVG